MNVPKERVARLNIAQEDGLIHVVDKIGIADIVFACGKKAKESDAFMPVERVYVTMGDIEANLELCTSCKRVVLGQL